VKITEACSTNNWATLFNGESYVLIIAKMDRATFLATFFFTNASGHPGAEAVAPSRGSLT
jgi:hypothetical protein